ncbi:MAG: C/D box methylation guide ribonucleoprotein complex aNOP56 subunit [Candidatus Thorarchaeota archaeon]|nr:MAG: C/D box methylation guide ribonucleoprotein complex aNOP56 subunit [Candidatus Thorarchaeota archaeon]
MTTFLVLTSFGFFLLDKDGEVVSKQLTYPDSVVAASEISAVDKGEVTENLRSVVGELSKLGTDGIVAENSALGQLLSQVTEIPVSTEEGSSVTKWFREGHDSYLVENGILESKSVADSFRREVSIQLARAAITAASEERDLLVKHAIDAIGEIDKSINVLVMRLREWYSLHHPSLSRLVEDQDLYSRIVVSCGGRSDVSEGTLTDIGVSESLARSIMESLEKDIGAPFEPTDLAVVRSLADGVQSLYKKRVDLEGYVAEMMSSVAPNITALVGPLVGARLISLAGSLKDLAKKPSSTVQVFGAEKALFRSLKTGADPPKHGIIYQVPEVHTAPYWQRGKIARALAGKISIAARIDAYSKRDAGESLRQKFLERTEEIKRQNPEAPPPKPPKKRAGPPRRAHGKKRGKRGGSR